METEHGLHDESVHDVEVDPLSKTRVLQTEQEKAQANDIYEVQLNRLEECIVPSKKLKKDFQMCV